MNKRGAAKKDQPIRIVAKTGFTRAEIERQRRKGNKAAVLEMEVYNMRALRGDFDRA